MRARQISIVGLAIVALTCRDNRPTSTVRALAAARQSTVAKLAPSQVASLNHDIDAIDQEIARATVDDNRLAGGLIKALIGSELATLRQTRAMLQQRLKADEYDIPFVFTIDGKPFTKPASADLQLPQIQSELERSDRQIEAQEAEVAKWNGGLVKALSESTLATMRNTRAMLDQRRASLTYGLPQYLPFNVQSPPAAPGDTIATAASTTEPTGQAPHVAPPTSSSAPLTVLESNYYEAESVLKAHCSDEWPSDFHMREVCEREQREGVETLKSTRPPDVPVATMASIRAHCEQEWPKDFHMRTVCERDQIEGYRHTR